MKKFIWTAVLMLSLAFAFSGEAMAKTAGGTIHSGVYLDEIDVSGMTAEEAGKALADHAEELKSEKLTLMIGSDQLEITLGEFGLTCGNQEVVEEALKLGRTGNIIRRYKEQKDLAHENKVYKLEWELDRDLVAEYVNTACVQFDREAEDATLKRNEDSFEVVKGAEGVKLDIDGSIAAITDYMENEWEKTDGSVSLPVEVDYPKGSEEELQRVKDVLGTFTTRYSTSDVNRATNVANGAGFIDGIVMYPGDEFSMYDVASPFTEENGYAAAGAYLNGKVIDSIGGGVCQVSTTLYNAVLLSELEVTERANHSMTVTYVDPAADAAIAGTYKNFRFKNNTDAPVYIEGKAGKGSLTFTIYGEETRPSNRTIKFVSKTLSTTDPGQVIVADPGQPIGFWLVEGAHWGCVAELYKYVYVDGKEESVERVNKSNYIASPRTITVGIAGDPNLSAELQAAIATQDEATANATMASCLARMQ